MRGLSSDYGIDTYNQIPYTPTAQGNGAAPSASAALMAVLKALNSG